MLKADYIHFKIEYIIKGTVAFNMLIPMVLGHSNPPGSSWSDQGMDAVGWHLHLGGEGCLLGGKFGQLLTHIDLSQVVLGQASLRQAGEWDGLVGQELPELATKETS